MCPFIRQADKNAYQRTVCGYKGESDTGLLGEKLPKQEVNGENLKKLSFKIV